MLKLNFWFGIHAERVEFEYIFWHFVNKVSKKSWNLYKV